MGLSALFTDDNTEAQREALALAVIKLGLGLNQGVSACEVCALSHYTLWPPESPPPPARVREPSPARVREPSLPVYPP